MSKPIVTHGICPYCNHNECYSEWEDGNFFCHSCGADPKKYPKEKRKTATVDIVDRKIIPYRNLNKKVAELYKVETGFDKDGKELVRYYPYPHKEKNRRLPKDFKDNYGFTADHLFGMDKFNSGSKPFITIVEGEDDTLAAWEMLGGTEAVVGLPSATISGSLLQNCYKWLNGFSAIIVATDGDEAGDRAADKLAATFPGKIYRVHLTKHKDAMEYLANGDRNDFKTAWANRTKYVPPFDTSTPDAYIKLLYDEDDDAFIPTGIEAFDEKHLGLFQGHVTLFQAPEGTGKTELFHYFEHHFIKNYPEIPFASSHLEESEKRTLLSWVSYELDKNVTRKDLIKDFDEVEETIRKLTAHENAHLFSISTDEDPMVLLDRIKYYTEVFGCKYFFIEPIQDLAQQGHNEANDERFLSKVAVNLARIAKEKKIGIVLIGHENDEGQISDCRKLSKQASVVVRLERDIENPDEDIRNITTLKSKKNRPTSFVGFAGQLKFNPKTFKLSEYY